MPDAHGDEIEDDQAEASPFEQEISGAENLLEAVFGRFWFREAPSWFFGSSLGNWSTPHFLKAPAPSGTPGVSLGKDARRAGE